MPLKSKVLNSYSVSTIKTFEYAVENNIPIHSVTKENISDELAILNVSDQLKQEIRSSVNSGKMVIIPEQEITINQCGIGYMVLDTETYACGYMISGGLAGGAMTWYEVLEEVALNVAIGLGVCLLVLALCIGLVALIPAAASVLAVVLPIIACIGAFAAGWSIGTHIYNFIETGEVREFQEGMIELASFGLLIGIGSKMDSLFKTSNGTSTADDAIQAADDALKTADDAIQAADDAVKNGACFVAGTLISTHNGLIPIEKILAGDMVYSFNQDTEKVSLKVVEESFIRERSKLVYVTVGNEIITATPEHPFYVAQKGFKNAVDLRAGDVLLTVNGEYVVVEQIKHEILESPMKVYNFRVADNHTYFVGDTGVGAHNTANGCGSNTKGGNTTANDWNGKTGELAKQSPLKIPENAKVSIKTKTGYEQISYNTI